MKKAFSLILTLSLSAGLLAGCSGSGTEKRVVNVCSWGEYIDESLIQQFEEATGIETRATILGHMQRGGSPTCKDRVYASTMGCYAVDLLCQGKSNRVVAYRNGEFVDYDIDEALAMKKSIPEYQYEICRNLSI